MEILSCEQNSEEWYRIRAGLPTASRFKTILSGGRAGGDSLTRKKYLYTLAGEILTGEPAESYTNYHMQRGHDMEQEARNYYSLITDNHPQQVGFVRSGNKGCSPDSLIGDDGLLEIKTALPAILIDLILRNRFPPEHKAQVQGQLWITERKWADLIVYARNIPPFIIRAERDEPYIRMLEDEVNQFNEELNAIVARIRNYGGQDVEIPEVKVIERKKSPYHGLRQAARMRIEKAIERLLETGSLRRSDIQQIGEVSVPQASKDISEIKKRFPDLMEYDRSSKRYILKSRDILVGSHGQEE